MTTASRGQSNTHSTDATARSRASESAEIARQTVEYIASHGAIVTTPIERVTVESIKRGHQLLSGKSRGFT